MNVCQLEGECNDLCGSSHVSHQVELMRDFVNISFLCCGLCGLVMLFRQWAQRVLLQKAAHHDAATHPDPSAHDRAPIVDGGEAENGGLFERY